MMAEIQINEETNEVVGNQNNARVALLERMNDANDRERAEELMDVMDDGSTAEFVPAPLEAEEGDAVAEPGAEPAEEPGVEPVAEPVAAAPVQKIRIKVNGQEFDLTQEELIARAQKVTTADAYLAEAARIRREAEQRLAQSTTQTPAPVVETRSVDEERALVRAIQMGSEEEAIAALRKLNTPANPPLNPDDLARTVDERLTFKEAVSRFETTFSDITSDRLMLNLALQRDQELLARGDRRDYWERYNEIGTALREYKRSIGESYAQARAQAEPAAPVVDKQTRKAEAPSVPQASAKKSEAQRVEDDKEESAAEVIANMAKSRGGPQWARA
jgi:hypothetical protein